MDATNINAANRKDIFQALSEFECQFVACVLNTNKKDMLKKDPKHAF